MPRPRSALTEVETRATLAAFDAVGGLEQWIAEQPWMAVPGGIGAFGGAYLLVYASTAEATAGLVEPVVAIFLFCLGVYVLAKFSFRRTERPVDK